MTEAVYDLSTCPVCFNFMEFLVSAKTYGATGIVFDDTRGHKDKYSPEDTIKRLESIVLPCCALAGLPYRFGKAAAGMIDCGYHITAAKEAFRAMGRIEKLKTVKPAGSARYTVTLRNYDRIPVRNSNTKAWRRFAEDMGAVVIEDWLDKRIDLHDRMALYAGAEMNFGVTGGPFNLCDYSDYPYLEFLKAVSRKYQQCHDWPHGSQMPWAGVNQRIIWENDEYSNIVGHWNKFKGELDGQKHELQQGEDVGHKVGQLGRSGFTSGISESR